MMSLHSNKNLTKTEVGTRDWGIAVIGLTMLLFGVIGTLGLWKGCRLEKQADVLSID